MRRAMTHSAMVFASVLTIVALAGCGSGSGKTAATPPLHARSGAWGWAAGTGRRHAHNGTARRSYAGNGHDSCG